jgi:hypothetical protein
MHLRTPATPPWPLAQLCAEAALCLVLGAASFGRPDDQSVLGAAAGLLALGGVAVIAFAALTALLHAGRSRRKADRRSASPTTEAD